MTANFSLILTKIYSYVYRTMASRNDEISIKVEEQKVADIVILVFKVLLSKTHFRSKWIGEPKQ